jgi:hypothetical protein
MSLPPPSSGAYWKDYQIDTPTFELTPVEKPDMSPFLVHMTGKISIEHILKGDGSPTPLPPNYGYLSASIPEYDQGIFNASVVCFSESPTFALDFFRYRSFRRWQDDQRFGIGFKKGALIQLGVRPVVYIDEAIRGSFIHLYKLVVEGNIPISNDAQIEAHARTILTNLYPFLFPLLEDRPEQGFMWEREWRYPNPAGLSFPLDSIAVICSPDDEEEKIMKLLGELATEIQFVNTWREYDEVTNYLYHQQGKWLIPAERVKQAEGIEEAIGYLSQVSQRYEVAINSLSAFDDFISNLSAQKDALEKERASLQGELDKTAKQISTLQTELEINKRGG